MGRFGKVLLILAASLAVVGCQGTGSLSQLSGAPTGAPLTAAAGLPPSSAMPAGQASAQAPAGFASFCLRFAGQCQTAPEAPAPLALDAMTVAKIAAVNHSVNREIRPEEDARHYGRAEYWTIPTDGYGDCDDYAVTKRAKLIAAGIPANTLRLAVAVTRRNVRHAVLTVTTTQGDYVLDSLHDEILPWTALGYQWMMRQQAENAHGWASLQPGTDSSYLMTAANLPKATSARN
jgi:predicted transglutaminase-like cysteine proteinase